MGTMVLSMRERMKLETNRELARAAQDLVDERGLGSVTVDDIASAVGVSVRTFFNYFACKEAAVVGIPSEVIEGLATELRARPAEEGPLEALRAVVLMQTEQEAVRRRWQLRSELVQREPSLLPHYLAALVQLEQALVTPLAERMGVDPSADPSPVMLVASVLGALRAGTAWWERSDHALPVEQVQAQAFTAHVILPG